MAQLMTPPFLTIPIGQCNLSRSTFISGVDKVDEYLHKIAGQYEKEGLAKHYVCEDMLGDAESIAGFYSLSQHSIPKNLLPEDFTKKGKGTMGIPFTLIGFMGIHWQKRSSGFGSLLLADALRRSVEIADKVGSVGVVVDLIQGLEPSKEKKLLDFYQRFGFQSLPESPNTLILSMKTIRRNFSAPSG